MKVSLAALVALPAIGSSAFAPSVPGRRTFSSTKLASTATIVTGPAGKAAKSKEEDLMLTLQIIMDHEVRSTTVSKEQFIAQMQEIASTPEPETRMDVSVPYDAAAQLAYESSDKKIPYADFKIQYEAEAVALVKSKQQPKKMEPVAVDLSVPYDAAAKLAYEASDKKMNYADFKLKYEEGAVELVKSKQPKKEAAPASSSTTASTSATVIADLSVPYDAAAQLAYASTDKSMPFADFKIKYEAEAVELVKSKRK